MSGFQPKSENFQGYALYKFEKNLKYYQVKLIFRSLRREEERFKKLTISSCLIKVGRVKLCLPHRLFPSFDVRKLKIIQL